jgi:hypothetical protein
MLTITETDSENLRRCIGHPAHAPIGAERERAASDPNAEIERLRAEVQTLTRALDEAQVRIDALVAERDAALDARPSPRERTTAEEYETLTDVPREYGELLASADAIDARRGGGR